MKRSMKFGLAFVTLSACLAAQGADAGKRVYQVTASGTDGIDLVQLDADYYKDRFAGSAADVAVCVTGTVRHAVAPGAFLGLLGQGGTLNLWRTGLFTDGTLNTPIRLGGSGVFDFWEETLALGPTWARLLAWEDGATATLRLRGLSVTDTSGTPFVFRPGGPLCVSDTEANNPYVRFGQDGGRVDAVLDHAFGCKASHNVEARDNRYTKIYIGGASTAGGPAGYAHVTVNEVGSNRYFGHVVFSDQVTDATSRQAAQGLTNTLTLACGVLNIPCIHASGPEDCLIRFARAGAVVYQPGWHGELFQWTGETGGGFVVEGAADAPVRIHFSECCHVGGNARIAFRGDGDVEFGIVGRDLEHANTFTGDNLSWEMAGDLVFVSAVHSSLEKVFARVSGAEAFPSGAGRGAVRISPAVCVVLEEGTQRFNSLEGGGTLLNAASGRGVFTVGCDGGDCVYDVASATEPLSDGETTYANAGWDVVKTGGGTLTLRQATPGLLTVEEGDVKVTEDGVLADGALLLREGTRLVVAENAALEIDADVFADGSVRRIHVAAGGTLVVGGDGEDETVDLAGVTGDVSARLRKVGGNTVSLVNADGFKGARVAEAGALLPATLAAATWTGGAGADTAFGNPANWGLSAGTELRGFTATFGTGGERADVLDETLLQGIVFDQTAPGRTAFTLAGPAAVGLAADGIDARPSADGTARAYTVAAPLVLAAAQTTWQVGDADVARAPTLTLCGPLASAWDGIVVTKKGMGDVNLCATGSTSTATLDFTTTGTVHVAGRNAWGGAGSRLILRKGNRVAFDGGTFDGDLEMSLGASEPACFTTADGSTNVFTGTVKMFDGRHRWLIGRNALMEFHGPFFGSGWTYGSGKDRTTSVMRFFDTCTINGGQWAGMTFDFRAPGNDIGGGDICLKYGACIVLLNCDGAWNTTKPLKIWNSCVVDICGHENRVGSLQVLHADAYVTNSGAKATLWTDAWSAALPEQDGNGRPLLPVVVCGDFKGPVTLGKTGPCDITITNRAVSACGDLVVAQGRLALCDKSSWRSVEEVVVTNASATAGAVLEIRQGETFGKAATVRLGNGGKLRLGASGVDAPFTQKIGYLFLDGVRQPVGRYSADAGNGKPRVAGTRACANLEGDGVLLSLGDGRGLTVILR